MKIFFVLAACLLAVSYAEVEGGKSRDPINIFVV